MDMHTRPPRPPLNGVDTPMLISTVNAVANQPHLGRFQFRADNRWIEGTRSRSAMGGYFGAGDEQMRPKAHFADGDHPAMLCGTDQAPTPVEWLLHGLAACITAGMANIAAARGVKLSRVESHVEGDIDLRGILGISDDVRNGFERIRISFRVEGDASPEMLRAIVEQARARSAVFDVLTKGVPVSVDVQALH
ncbi:MAG: OsmC family protein [Pararhizobium sp.]